ncbi:hypothetical protein [Nostoc sp. DSM 114167]|uniref:hypothetical protein n=1 Tax=Nostoc sp. DSM 114167 TaxID=3439050 RepID=UPI004045B74C
MSRSFLMTCLETTPLFLAIRMVIYSRSPALTDYISSKADYDRRIIPQKIKVASKKFI